MCLSDKHHIIRLSKVYQTSGGMVDSGPPHTLVQPPPFYTGVEDLGKIELGPFRSYQGQMRLVAVDMR